MVSKSKSNRSRSYPCDCEPGQISLRDQPSHNEALPMSIHFRDKVVAVTGGAMGIGEATARKFAELGAAVAIMDVNTDAGQKTAQALGKQGRAEFYPCNVGSPSETELPAAAVIVG